MNKIQKAGVKIVSKISVISSIGAFFLFGARRPIFASNFLPNYVQEILDKVTGAGHTPSTYVNNRVKSGLTMLFVGVFIVAIVYSALAAIKFISSQGDSSKLEQSKAAVKAILMGFAAMLVAIIGIFVILWVLGATSTPGQEIIIDQPT